ncbi:MAG: alpha/beta fold hydrolase [Paracoccaceae bacterium]|nr:alpha/beta fold hydrolase [Paracoccaceae bacterium]MDP7185854.1 alpha/beta fold hydrolase [Paracoccaceae bacterium]
MMCDGRLFAPQIASFSAERPVMVMPLTGADTVVQLAKDILNNAPPVFSLAGLSMGGIVAMEVIRQAPDRVSRLALLDTNPRAELPQVARNRLPQIDAVSEGGLEKVMRDEMKPNYLVDGLDKPRILDLCMTMALTLGAGVFISQSRALATRPDQQETLKAIKVPTLILCGRDDIPCPVERHELMHGLVPESSLVIIEGAGHLPVLEKPNQTNKALDAWLN